VPQLVQARGLEPDLPVAAADLARLPVRDGSLGAIVAFYCLIYGPATHLDAVFAEWRRALAPGGLVAVAVHIGEGIRDMRGERDGETWDLTVVLRDPDDLVRRLEAHGLEVDERTTRRPHDYEMPADHLFLVARRTSQASPGEPGELAG
jgi:SAM-dependent methyltransferase